MSADILWGVVLGFLLATVLIFAGLGLAQWLDRSKREQEIQARLNRASNKIQENETLLQEALSEKSKLVSDLQVMRKVCGDMAEDALVYFEQNPVIFGERNRDRIVGVLHEVLAYAGRSRTTPVALLEHLNGGSNDQSTNAR